MYDSALEGHIVCSGTSFWLIAFGATCFGTIFVRRRSSLAFDHPRMELATNHFENCRHRPLPLSWTHPRSSGLVFRLDRRRIPPEESLRIPKRVCSHFHSTWLEGVRRTCDWHEIDSLEIQEVYLQKRMVSPPQFPLSLHHLCRGKLMF
jgi:hypothetical protein